jgi:hypothetical protein
MTLIYIIILWVLLIITLCRMFKCLYSRMRFRTFRNNVVDIDNGITINNNFVADNNSINEVETDICSDIESLSSSGSFNSNYINENDINDIEKGIINYNKNNIMNVKSSKDIQIRNASIT